MKIARALLLAPSFLGGIDPLGKGIITAAGFATLAACKYSEAGLMVGVLAIAVTVPILLSEATLVAIRRIGRR